MNLRDLLYRLTGPLVLESKRRLFHLEVEAKDIELLTIKDFVQRVCDAAGCSPKETSNIKLAIDEACTNIIRHAYEGKPGGKITMEMGIGIRDLRVRIVDYGKSFDFKQVKDPDLDHYVDIGKKGGLGIWLIKKVMTDVQYHPHSDRNELILHRRLSKAPPGALGLKAGSTSISAKFAVGSMVLLAIMAVPGYFYLSYRQAEFVTRQEQEKIHMMLQGMSAQAGRAIAGKGDLELDRLLREVRKEDGAGVLDYLFVLGSEGRYLAHSDLSKLFREHVPPPGVQVNREPGVQSFRRETEHGPLTDYVSAVHFKGKWVGEVHVGVSDRSLDALMDRERSKFRQLFLLLFLGGLLGLYLLSRIVIRPFRRILEGVHAISQGDLSGKIELDTQDEFGQLAEIFNQMTTRIQDSQKGLMEQERIQKEMQVAQEIQHTLLPAEFPQIEGYEVGAAYRSAKEVGGDYYDFFWVDPTTLGIVVADVSGKGVPGSMVMTMIRTAMRLEARGNKSASDVLGKVNRHVTSDMKRGMFVTMFYIILDSRNRTINFASAGHNPMILWRGKTKEVYCLTPQGFPVGIDLPELDMFEKNMALQKINLEKDDMLVIYTDGITEAMDPDKNQFGEDRLVEVIKENGHLSPQDFVQKLGDTIARFTRGAEQNDDITLVAIKEKMRVEQAVFKFRKKLIDLVDVKGLSVAEACRRMNISPKAYYRYKKILNEKGKAGLKPVRAKGRDVMKELSQPQKRAVLSVVKEHPEYEPKRIAEEADKILGPAVRLDRRVVRDFLKRKRLEGAADRKEYAVNEVDTP